MAISHADHDHPNTPAARAKCRREMDSTHTPYVNPVRELAEGAGLVKPKVFVAPSVGRKGLREAAEAVKTRKKVNTKIKVIGDLADMPRMLAYAVRLAWAHDELEVVTGHPFNDTEANVIIKGPAAHITLMWKVARPDGISAMRIRPVDSSLCVGDATSAQQAVDIARGVEPIPGR